MQSGVAPQQRIVEVPLETVFHRGGVEVFLSILLQIVLVQPAFHSRATLVGFYKSYRNVQGLSHCLGKEIARGTKLADGHRTTDAP